MRRVEPVGARCPTSARTDVAVVIGASAMLAYLFIPFRSGSKPPFGVVFGHFATALAVVGAASRLEPYAVDLFAPR